MDRLTDGSSLIKEMTLEALQALDAAYDWSADDRGAAFPFSAAFSPVDATGQAVSRNSQQSPQNHTARPNLV